MDETCLFRVEHKSTATVLFTSLRACLYQLSHAVLFHPSLFFFILKVDHVLYESQRATICCRQAVRYSLHSSRHLFQLHHVHGGIVGCVDGRRTQLSPPASGNARDAPMGKLFFY